MEDMMLKTESWSFVIIGEDFECSRKFNFLHHMTTPPTRCGLTRANSKAPHDADTWCVFQYLMTTTVDDVTKILLSLSLNHQKLNIYLLIVRFYAQDQSL